MEAGKEFQFVEVMGTSVLANEVVPHFTNLTAKKKAIWTLENILFNSSIERTKYTSSN